MRTVNRLGGAVALLASLVVIGRAEATPRHATPSADCATEVTRAIHRAFTHSMDEVLRALADHCQDVPEMRRAARVAFPIRTDGPQWRDLSLQIELRSLFPACELDDEPHFYFTLTAECRASLHLEQFLNALRPFELIPSGAVLFIAAIRREVFKLGPDDPDTEAYGQVMRSLALSTRNEMEVLVEGPQ